MKAMAVSPRRGSYEGLSAQDLLRAYRTMVLSRKLDDKEIQLKNQSLIFFQISGAGHEVLLSAVGAKDDPNSGGRQMPSHWGHKGLNIVSQSSPTGTQCLHAIGTAEAGRLYERVTAIAERESQFHGDEVTYISIGDGTTSEGEFWESLNSACTLKLPVVYVIEDNGYAISVPVEVQTAGGDISKLVASFPGLLVQSVDGTDFLASYKAMHAAVEYARARRGPALVHAKVTRPYSHSLSDDEKLYKTADERAAEARRDPITKLANFLVAEEIASEAELEAIVREVDAEVNAAAETAKASE